MDEEESGVNGTVAGCETTGVMLTGISCKAGLADPDEDNGMVGAWRKLL